MTDIWYAPARPRRRGAEAEDELGAPLLASALFSGDPQLEAVAAGRLRLGRRGDPPYPAPILSRGTGVAKVQQALLEVGYPLPHFGVDGRYGNETYGAVYGFKRDRGIRTVSGYLDGILGPATIIRLDAQLPRTTPSPGCTTRPATSIPDTTVKVRGVDFRFAMGVRQFNPARRGEVAIQSSAQGPQRVLVSMHREDAAQRCRTNAWAYSADVSDPPDWRFGFVQNVVDSRHSAAYASGALLRSDIRTPRIDALTTSALPFFAGFALGTTGSGKEVCIQDSPQQSFPLALGGSPIRSICINDRFRVFLVVQRTIGAPIIPLVMKEIVVCRGFRPADPTNPGGSTWLAFGHSVEFTSVVAPAAMAAPVLTPPLANDSAAKVVEQVTGSCNAEACPERNDLCPIGCCPVLITGPCCSPL
jgi:hypothetical protein